MPNSKSKSNARAARTRGKGAPRAGALAKHPGMSTPHPGLAWKLGGSEAFRLPDDVSDQTAVTVLRNEFTLSSNANGDLVTLILPSLAITRYDCTIVGTQVSTTGAGVAHPQSTSFNNDTKRARMNAYRVTVTYIGAELESAGYVSSFQRNEEAADVVNAFMDNLHTHANIQHRATEGLLVEATYTQTPRWEDPAAVSTINFMKDTFPYVAIVASGLPLSKPVFRVKVERVMEYLPKEGALSEGDVAFEPHDPGAESVLHAANHPRLNFSRLSGIADRAASVFQTANAAYHMAKPVMPYLAAQGRAYLIAAAARTLPMLAM